MEEIKPGLVSPLTEPGTAAGSSARKAREVVPAEQEVTARNIVLLSRGQTAGK